MSCLSRTLRSGRFRARSTKWFGPFFVHFASNGGRPRLTSWGVRLFGVTRNFTRRTTSIETPGPGAVHFRDADR